MTSSELLAAYLLDYFFGDPPKFPHPVRGMGRVIALADRYLRPSSPHPFLERLGGVLLAVGLPATVYLLSDRLIDLAGMAGSWGAWSATVYLAFTALAAGSLRNEALGIQSALVEGRLPEARQRLSRIVSRRTEDLKEEEIVRGGVESVAENASDGVIAPLFYLLIGGAPLAIAYKAINTLDSMVGYRNARYREFGWASARLDDLVNLIPSRLTGILICFTVFPSWRDMRKAWGIFLRDGGNDDSPNSGWPEAAMAGALGVRLGGPVDYDFGRVEKETIGDPSRPLTAETLSRAVRLMERTVLLMVLAVAGTLWMWRP
jgi:adenosylcobinamide-phosphate synthase